MEKSIATVYVLRDLKPRTEKRAEQTFTFFEPYEVYSSYRLIWYGDVEAPRFSKMLKSVSQKIGGFLPGDMISFPLKAFFCAGENTFIIRCLESENDEMRRKLYDMTHEIGGQNDH